jgi:mono/diheme cytochrome c family protein/glucose/arabinose dehydrogenase
MLKTRQGNHRIFNLIAGSCIAGLLAGLLATAALGKHKTNPGPEDPPIKFHLPPPEPLSAEEELKTFKVQDGLKIELAAAEPLVEDPVAMSFDADGRMWVVEMCGYMHDIDGGGEDQPTGRIKVLESSKGDGVYDKATVFLDGLYMPRAVLPTRGGALVAEPPELAFWKASKGDFKADQKTIVANDYGRRGGQPEVMANGLMPGLDNWIYSASHTARYRFRRGKWEAEPFRGSGQWGISQDNYGRLFYCYNTDLARADLLPGRYLSRNPYYKPTATLYAQLIKDQPVWPSHPTPGTNRGYTATELRTDGTLTKPTAACGISVYRGDLFPPSFAQNLFTPEPAGNLIKRYALTEAGGKLSAHDVYEHADFFTSTDERFRPVNTCTGPDGALYVVDMYRGVIQHTAFLTNYLIKNIQERKLISPIHRGRIWRIVPDGPNPKPVAMAHDIAGLVAQLGHPNGWVRDMAQRLLIEKRDPDSVELLQQAVQSAKSPLARLHALWTLDGLERLEPFVTLKALNDVDEHVRAAAVRLTEPPLVPAMRAQAMPRLLEMATDPSPIVQLHVAMMLSGIDDPAAENAVIALLSHTRADPAIMRDAVFSGLRGRELKFMQNLMKQQDWAANTQEHMQAIVDLTRCVMGEHRPSQVKALLEVMGSIPDGAWQTTGMLTGSLPPTPKKGATTRPAPGHQKLIYLDAEPAALEMMLKSEHGIIKSRAQRLDQRLAWPGKPGVPPPPKIIPLTPSQQAQFDRGKAVFSQLCTACHQPTGLGQDGLAPPLVDSEWVLGSDKRLARIVIKGLVGPISVEGADFDLEMPTLSALSDEDIAAALTYVRREWENNASPVSVQTVAQVRQEIENRSEPWTAKELLEVK